MNITEVRVKLMQQRSDRLRAFASITIEDDFVVHDLRVIEGRNGFFVAMPSRKLSDSCGKCGSKNELRAKFCGNCGARLDEDRATRGPQARDKLHVDVAHPINTACREMLQEAVLRAYHEEEARAGAGLPPAREYSMDGLDELTVDYEELDFDEPKGAVQPLGPVPHETAATEPPEPDQLPAQPDAEPEPSHEAPRGPDAAPSGAAAPPEVRPVSRVEPAEEEETEGEPDVGSFGEGIF